MTLTPNRSSQESDTAIGIDIGGTKIALATVTSEGAVLDYRNFSSRGESADSIWAQLRTHVRELAGHIRRPTIGVGSAGPIDVDAGWISPVNIPSLRRFPIVDNLRDLGVAESVVLHGDAIAFTHAEHQFGAGRGVENMLGMVVSTGIGGGLVLDNKLVLGDSGNAGFIGHTVVDLDGDECPCGRKGCVEVFSSGPQMVNFARRNGWNASEQATFQDLAADAAAGQATARAAIDRGTRALSIAIVNQLAMLDMKVAVIGGGVSLAGEVFWEPLRRHVQSESIRIGFLDQAEVRPAVLAEHSGVIGAALAVLDPTD